MRILGNGILRFVLESQGHCCRFFSCTLSVYLGCAPLLFDNIGLLTKKMYQLCITTLIKCALHV
jgi:hypothetical protein